MPTRKPNYGESITALQYCCPSESKIPSPIVYNKVLDKESLKLAACEWHLEAATI
jgi:hypothetical protein